MNAQERNQLIDALIEGEITESDFLRLEAEFSVDPAARSEYYRRMALTASLEAEAGARIGSGPTVTLIRREYGFWIPMWARIAAMVVLAVGAGWWGSQVWHPTTQKRSINKTVAMLNRTANAQWKMSGEMPRLGTQLEPGLLRLESGMAEIVFYSGARMVIEGPAELQLISQTEAFCRRGRMVAEIPSQARGFRIQTPGTIFSDVGTSFGLAVKERSTELQVFKGVVEMRAAKGSGLQTVAEGAGAVAEESGFFGLAAFNPAPFAGFFEMHEKSVAAQTVRYEKWRETGKRLNIDPSLLLHLEFENEGPTRWDLKNSGQRRAGESEPTLVGCEWTEGRWPEKRALEFQNANDRVRVSVGNEFESLTLTTWVRVYDMDHPLNGLFMCDGWEEGTLHWLIRDDGVLGLTIIGSGKGNFQIVTSAPVITPNRLGLWMHLGLVIDGRAMRVTQYVNGISVGSQKLKLGPPYNISVAELGNWNTKGFAGDERSLSRNFSGAMDEFCLFNRPLGEAEMQAVYSAGKPQAEPWILPLTRSKQPTNL